MGKDDLTKPVTGKNNSFIKAIPIPMILFGLLGILVATMIGWVFIVDDPLGGEPRLVAKLPQSTDSLTGTDIGVIGIKTNLEPDTTSTPDTSSQSGSEVLQDIPQLPTVDEITITDPSNPTTQITTVGPLEQLLERTEAGFIPRVASDGTRSRDAYARKINETVINANLPRIAIVVGGLGLSASTTDLALETLPVDVTLAFAPYGQRLEDLARRARQKGYELILQIPMEPYDFPNNDPGPHTLLTGLKPTENLDRLHWVMAQMQSYAGVVNYMGARYSAEDSALTPTLTEFSNRGLYYLDDGSSPRSRVPQVANTVKLPTARANLVIDALTDAPSIEARLLQLEAIARERGLAIGMASAYPVSIEVIARWAKDAANRGVVLVPISAAIRAETES